MSRRSRANSSRRPELRNRVRAAERKLERWEHEETDFFMSGIRNIAGIFKLFFAPHKLTKPPRKVAKLKSPLGVAVARVKTLKLKRDLQIGAKLGAPFRALGRGVATLWTAVVDLFKQVFGDVWHGLKWIGHQCNRVVAAFTWPVRQLIGTIARPIRNRAARQAKAKIDRPATTADHHLHWELLALLIGTAVLVGTAAYVTVTGGVLPKAGGTGILDQLFAKLTPARITAWLGRQSPQQLAVLGGVGVMLLGLTAFWVAMVRDSWRRSYDSSVEQIKWRLTTSTLFIAGALFYFFHVYNHWTIRQFVSYHFVSVATTGIAVVVMSSMYGTLLYFNAKAEAQVRAGTNYRAPNVQLDAASQQALLNRSKYGASPTPAVGGRVDPFAPLPGQVAAPTPTLSASPSPSASPTPTP